MKMKPFKAWLLRDAEDTYEASLHSSRRRAMEEAKRWSYLRDAKWRVVRVVVRLDSRTAK